MRSFDNQSFDRFLASANKIIADLNHGGLALVTEEGERKRLIYSIESFCKKAKLAPDAYVGSISAAMYGLGGPVWRDWCIADLTNLRNTIKQRVTRKTCDNPRYKRPPRRSIATPLQDCCQTTAPPPDCPF